MVGVPVAAGGVVADEDVGAHLVAQGRDASRDGEPPGMGEAVGDVARQPGVGIAEGLGPRDAKGPRGGLELGSARAGEVGLEAGRRQALGAVGRDEQDDRMPLGNGAGHGAGREQGFVVRMRVHEHEGAGRAAHGRHCGVRSATMRIAHVSDCYAPRTGGIETQVRALAGRQASSGDEVRVITATPGHGEVFAGDDVVDGLTVHRVAAHLPFELPVHPRTGREVGRLLDAHRVDVVHVHAGVVSPFAWGAVRAATRRGIPTLVTVHSVWGPLARPGFSLSDALVRWTGWGVTLSAVSEVAAARMSAALSGAQEVLVVPNGIDPADWTVIPEGADDGRLRVVTVMRMAPRKRTLPLVRVLAEAASVLAPGVRLTATIVGDGPERARAQKHVREHALDDTITFTGRLDRGGIRDVFARSDVYLQPSVKESFGLAALEARAAGLPVVARTQTGTTQFIHDGVQGLLAADDSGLARALVALGRDRALLASITAHNRGTPPQDAWPHVLDVVRAAYARAGVRPG